MESVVRFFDEVDDFIISTLIRLRRALSWKPRERRRVPRTRDMAAKPTTESDESR